MVYPSAESAGVNLTHAHRLPNNRKEVANGKTSYTGRT